MTILSSYLPSTHLDTPNPRHGKPCSRTLYLELYLVSVIMRFINHIFYFSSSSINNHHQHPYFNLPSIFTLIPSMVGHLCSADRFVQSSLCFTVCFCLITHRVLSKIPSHKPLGFPALQNLPDTIS